MIIRLLLFLIKKEYDLICQQRSIFNLLEFFFQIFFTVNVNDNVSSKQYAFDKH